MTALALADVVGFWLGIFLTFCILSFLYKDNPFYKFAEHLFIGVSVGYLVVQQYTDNLQPKLVDAVQTMEGGELALRLVALVLVALMFVKAISRRWAWLGRYPLAFVVAFYAGLQINAVVTAPICKASVMEVIDSGITGTISRTIITHGCTQLMVLSMLFFGGQTLHNFAIALTIGICFGIYSSVFVAAAIAMWLGVKREDLVKPLKEKEETDGAVV